MSIVRPTVVSTIDPLAIGLIVVLLFASAFGDSTHSTTHSGTQSPQPSASTPEHERDLRLRRVWSSWPDEDKDVFVVTASVNPWCTSNWQSITYRVLRCGPQPYEPRVLLSLEQTIYLGAEDPPYRLEVGHSSFSLRFYGDKYQDFVSKGAEGNAEDESILELVRCRVEGDEVITEKGNVDTHSRR